MEYLDECGEQKVLNRVIILQFCKIKFSCIAYTVFMVVDLFIVLLGL